MIIILGIAVSIVAIILMGMFIISGCVFMVCIFKYIKYSLGEINCSDEELREIKSTFIKYFKVFLISIVGFAILSFFSHFGYFVT